MNHPEANVNDLWIQHQRRNTKTTKSRACIYCPERKTPRPTNDLCMPAEKCHQDKIPKRFRQSYDLWMPAEKCHQDKILTNLEELKRFRQSYESNSALKRPNKACEDATPRHRGPQSLSRVQSLGLRYDENNVMTDDKVMAGDRPRKRVAVGDDISAGSRSPFCAYSGRIHNAKQRQHGESPRGTPQSQSETRLVSQEQLVAEVKGIYASLEMAEAKCIEVDNKQAASANFSTKSKKSNEEWQALIIALHRTLLHEHHDFFLASQHPHASPALRRLASKYAMPARMWSHGISSFLEFIRDRLPISLDYMLSFIYLAYSVMATLYECKPSEYWVCSAGTKEEYHELSPNFKERKEHIPSRARDIPHNKISGHNPSSSQNTPTNKPTEHCDNVVHDNKLKTPTSRARSEELSPTSLPLTLLGFPSKLLAALICKKRLFASLLMTNIITVASGRVIPLDASETTTSLTSFNDSKPFQSLLDKSIRLLNLSSEALVALIVIMFCEVIRRLYCKEVQNRLLSATCMAASVSCFAYLRDAEDVTNGLLAGVLVAGAVFTWNTFAMGVEKYNFGTPYIIVGMILAMSILWGGYPYIQPLTGSVKVDVFILSSIIFSFSILEMVVKVHDDMTH
ncbi:hypothetical protein BOTCAL_0094g00320 [Botryotinia calthae]|uniref:Uncharacterized protein n=1 Tax=Botryotinia calthae TaxID=38488 RepID=A0A4Y8D762_9HELO|nr:hypothetical protein BOTCAL_0094g00320 [Botryotinia calthae]